MRTRSPTPARCRRTPEPGSMSTPTFPVDVDVSPPSLTPAAGRALTRFAGAWDGGNPALLIRAIAPEGEGAPPDLHLQLVEQSQPPGGDEREFSGDPFPLPVRIDRASLVRLSPFEMDYIHEGEFVGFQLRPVEGPPEGTIEDRVQASLDRRVNPLVESHGGQIHLLEVDDEGRALVEMRGGCQGCSAARETLNDLVSRILLKDVPELSAVEDVTDHDAGENPFFVPLTMGRGAAS